MATKIKRTPTQTKQHTEYTRQWLSKNYNKKLWYTAKHTAPQRNLEFTITPEDIIIPTHCPYLGVELLTYTIEGRQKYKASLDRIDSSKGYTPDNIQVISDLANRMKQNATTKELLAFAKGILKLYGTTDS